MITHLQSRTTFFLKQRYNNQFLNKRQMSYLKTFKINDEIIVMVIKEIDNQNIR